MENSKSLNESEFSEISKYTIQSILEVLKFFNNQDKAKLKTKMDQDRQDCTSTSRLISNLNYLSC